MARNTHIDPNLPKAKINAKTLNSLLAVFELADKKDQWLFLLGTLFLVLTALASLVFPGLSGKLIDTANSSLQDIDDAALPFVLLFAAQALFAFLRIYIFVYVTEKIIFKLRAKLFESVITKKYAFFTENRAGELTSRFGSDISQIQGAFTTHIAHLFRQIIVVIGGLSIMLYQYFAMAKFMLWIIPVVILIAMFFGKFIRKFSRNVQDQTAETNTVVDESIQAIHNVKSFANEWFELIRFKTSAEEIRKLATKRGLYRAMFSSFIIICLFGAIVILIWQAIKLVTLGEITMGDMSAFLIYNAVVAGAIGGLSEKYLQVQKSLGSIDRVLDIIEEESEEIDLNKQDKILPIKGNVTFDKVNFSYDSLNKNKVLDNISFTANAGETIAIVGPSGAGKSTLVTLLMKFYDVDSGKITVEHKNIQDYKLSQYRNIFAMVPQEIVLFGGSIKDNIAYGKPDADMDEIIAAAQKANATEFINNFPNGYKTLVGDRGIKLSGGQKQRIAIARAVLKNPSILLLDEATSSLDSISENEVQKALDNLMKGRTSFVIAHRLSTIKDADKILVLNKGKLVQNGNYNQLIADDNGLFKELVKMQAING